MLQNREGQRVPNVTFQVRENNAWKQVTTDDIFKGKTVVVFSLPGAFTPTCSSTHLPRYNELAPTFAKLGVDSVVCLSVNDTFVMNEWAKDQESNNIVLLDGIVQKMFIEPEKDGDPFEVSDADTMLNYIDATAKAPDQVVVFSKPGCPFCIEAKALLDAKGYNPIEIPLDNKVRGRVIGAVSGQGTAPQIFINGEHVGGLDALKARFAKAA